VALGQKRQRYDRGMLSQQEQLLFEVIWAYREPARIGDGLGNPVVHEDGRMNDPERSLHAANTTCQA
jgi:hypothetical protein